MLPELKGFLDDSRLQLICYPAHHQLVQSVDSIVKSIYTLQHFLDKLPGLWKMGEVRPTHRKPDKPARAWRTRRDPFAGVWLQVLTWLEAEPDVTAKELFIRLMELHPDEFSPGQLRTLQRRVREWRQRMARALIFCGAEPEQETGSLGGIAY